MLHLLSRSRFRDPALYARVCQALNDGDALVFLGDGVLSLVGLEDGDLSFVQASFYVIEEDMIARGLSGQCPAGVSSIDMSALVELSVTHPRSISWH